jgi:hypothetical protein
VNEIRSFQDFKKALYRSGFSMGGCNSQGIYAIIPWGFGETPPYETPVSWHTEDPETDPWEWRIRVLNECDDIAYGKLFFNKSGYITKEWYPYFLSVRRGGISFREAYSGGTVSHAAKQIYEIIGQNDRIPLHVIKQEGGFGKEDKFKFDKAVTELQMKMYITMCGDVKKLSAKGEEYGWSSTMFCTVERFWDESVFDKAFQITGEQAIEKITRQIYILNPNADRKKKKKFIGI